MNRPLQKFQVNFVLRKREPTRVCYSAPPTRCQKPFLMSMGAPGLIDQERYNGGFPLTVHPTSPSWTHHAAGSFSTRRLHPDERTIRDILLRKTLPRLPPEIATDDTPRHARIFQSGGCAVTALLCALLTRYATSHFASGNGIMLLIIGLTRWLSASLPGLISALLAFDGAAGEERPVVPTLPALNGSLVPCSSAWPVVSLIADRDPSSFTWPESSARPPV